MITNQKYEPDIRIRREAEGLVEAGHEVHVACKGQYNSEPSGELNGVEITRICANSKILHNIAERVYAATLFQPVWLLKLREILENDAYDLVYYHDIEHAKLATTLANWYNLPVVADLHEMYPQSAELWRESLSLTSRLDPKVLFTPKSRLKRLERFAVTHADGLITVSGELLDYFIERYDFEGISGVVRNVPDLDRLDRMEVEDLDYEDDFIISYIGGFTPQRGIGIAIESMPQILRSVPDARLLLVGDGEKNFVSSLQRQCEELGISDRVEFTGWVDFESVRTYYDASDVTLVPDSSDYALPNKFFQSMAFRTPVVVNNHPSMRRIVNEYEVGLTFNEEKQLAEVLIDLAQSPETVSEMGVQGRDLVERRYNFEQESKTIDQIVRTVAQSRGSSSNTSQHIHN
ncbi:MULTISPECIES: glycosyltransferase family 4 protein [Halolamina]|uniref:Glycosyltransferase involved in cell wall bisynthesis n=1 Tax=Halolamina pelagica TaxID=699431 RepID=A0A1I5UZW1_9EURY|nr:MULTISPECIES: glycosyltransferase family 4 protein [Halolamina]NHX36804.1 glycosyltransferase family 4 protein [Halolamina sp. R1-12]SFQ00759.1 Glycosyltransferase involved in cell wall bisynthesis [Halolamina pelagica]